MSNATRRLWLALAASIMLHASILTPWRLMFADNSEAGFQPVVVATIRPLAPEPKKQPEPPQKKAAKPAPTKPDEQRPGEKRLAIDKSSAALPAAADTGEAAIAEPPPRDDDLAARDAYQIDQPLPPEYPPLAKERGIEGCVLAAVAVAADGTVSKVDILVAEPPGIFDQAVIESQLTTRYAAARRDGSPIDSRVLTVASFVIKPGTRLNCALKMAPQARRHLGEPRKPENGQSSVN